MTIDLSNLSPEKRAFLKAHPDLLKSLEQEIPKQARSFQARREKLERGKAKWQRDHVRRRVEDAKHKADEARQRAEELRRKYNPKLMEINRRLMKKAVRGSGSLVCPECGEGDHRNKMNGKPWCLKCNSPLVAESKVATWKKLPKVKVLPKGLRDELRRLNPGLYPKEDEK